MLAVNKVSRAAAEKKRERCFLVFTGWAVGHAILRKEMQVYSARPPHRTKNRKKCDETVKKRDELVKEAFFEPKKRGGSAMAPPLCCCSVRPCGEWVLKPTPASAQGASRFADSRASERTSWLACLSGPRCCRRGRVKIFDRGSNF